MKFIKSVFAMVLIAASMHAKPVKIQLSDKTIQYDDQALEPLKSRVVDEEKMRNQYWTGTSYEFNENAIIKLPIDSAGFAFMSALVTKTDAQIFSFIDSLDEQAFRLISFYTQLLKMREISDLLKYKMIKEPKLVKLAEVGEGVIENFINSKFSLRWNEQSQRTETLVSKYFNDNSNYYRTDFARIDGQYALLALIDFYQEQLKKSLPINTDNLKNIFNTQPYNVQQILINKNLVILS